MIIKKLFLQNIRSHLNSTVEFNEGFNCVVGGVGTGKTSILLSLHFALFGEPLYRSYEYLLREDKNRGMVTVEFEHAGKNYRLTRVLRREKGRIVQEPDELRLTENGKIIAWGKLAAVQEQLKSILGIDKKMFEEFIWIQQEKLKEILNMTPRERQKVLDELFGFSSFQDAWERLLPYQRHYEAVKTTLEKDPDIVEIGNLKKQYEDLTSDLIKLQVEVETLNVELKEAEKSLEEADKKLKSLENLEKKINELKDEKSSLLSKLSEVQAYIKSLKNQLNNKENEVDRDKVSLNQLRSEKNKILNQSSKTSFNEILETLEKIDFEVVKLRNEAADLKAEAKKIEESLLMLETENVCPTCRRELDQFYKEKLLNQLRTENMETEKRLTMVETKLENLEFEQKMFLDAKNKIEVLNFQVEELEKTISTKEDEINKIKAELDKKILVEADLKRKLDEITLEISKFKVEDVENARKLREEKLLRYREILDSIRYYEKLIEEKNSYLSLIEKRIQNAEQKLKQKILAEKVSKLISGLRMAYREVVPVLRKMYIESLRDSVQSVMDSLTIQTERSLYVDVDDEYTPTLVEASGFRRDVNLISGGERTWLALAYRIGLGQLIMEAKTGQNFELLILDEPTEALGTEDGSINALATAISNLKMIRQIITVTHSEELANEASTRILVTKKNGISKVEKI
ncbi:SMC family ATPase [Candidatus Bathyarchaeota archaeon]|nr:MAG: SMC family ATPase [Candidatus Bathyarchaeota archaeon]